MREVAAELTLECWYALAEDGIMSAWDFDDTYMEDAYEDSNTDDDDAFIDVDYASAVETEWSECRQGDASENGRGLECAMTVKPSIGGDSNPRSDQRLFLPVIFVCSRSHAMKYDGGLIEAERMHTSQSDFPLPEFTQ
jgi:hypothetical protein